MQYRPALLLATDESQGSGQSKFWGTWRSRCCSTGAESVSCGLGSVLGVGLVAVFVRFCAAIIDAVLVGVTVTY